MTMNASEANYDLVLTGAQICDPATGLDCTCDLAVTGDRIAAVGSGLASRARQVIELDGKLATAGWIDLHVHVFEWMTTFGLPPDVRREDVRTVTIAGAALDPHRKSLNERSE